MNEKYEMIENDTKNFNGHTLYRIRAKLDIGDDVKGDLGGYIEKEENLKVTGNARVYGNACVYGNAWVYGNAGVYGKAQVSGDARVSGNAGVYGNAGVSGNAEIRTIYDFFVVGPIGSRNGFTTFYRTKSDLIVSCGCFHGTIDEFEERVADVHSGTSHYDAYNAAIAMAKEILQERDEK